MQSDPVVGFSRGCIGRQDPERFNVPSVSEVKMMTTWNVSKLHHLNLAHLEPLLYESQREGFAFLQRLWQEYVEGIDLVSKKWTGNLSD